MARNLLPLIAAVDGFQEGRRLLNRVGAGSNALKIRLPALSPRSAANYVSLLTPHSTGTEDGS